MNRTEYLLVQLMEEAAEVQQAASKALRFGLDDIYDGISNRDRLGKEMTDFNAVAQILWTKKILPDHGGPEAVREKIAKVNKWCDHARANGTLKEP